MKFSVAFVVLLPCLPSIAFPVWVPPHTQPTMVTIPLKRLHVPRTDIHPQLLLQQHINRGNKRFARMTGSVAPTEHELRAEMHKRLYYLDPTSTATPPTPRHLTSHARRYHRHPIQSRNITSSASGSSLSSLEIDIIAAQNGGLTLSQNPTANNSLGLNIDANDVGYVATIQIGTPPQNFNILMDSGSADFWVGSQSCQSQQGGCGNHTFLGSNSSTSFVQSSQAFNITYGSGAVAGVLCQDNVLISNLQLTNHTFGVANEETVQFADSTVPFDGLMGLAQSTVSRQNVQTPVEAMASTGLISTAISSFKISRLADQLFDGEVTFGAMDANKFNASTLVSVPNINPQGFWEATMGAITVNGQDSGLNGRSAILDTGTTLIIAPPADTQAIMAMLGGSCDSQQCTIPCTSNASLALSFGNGSFAIDPSDMTILPVDANNPTGDCTAGIQAGTIGTNTEWLVGDVFLKNAYFSVNTQNNQISLAKLSTP